ncbi:MAG: class I SAM-dependent methyltransferase [Planctomycetaceae bacterium]|nr:class I SAM-dependent methyltransferase [Planctomycetaceae bacterium]
MCFCKKGKQVDQYYLKMHINRLDDGKQGDGKKTLAVSRSRDTAERIGLGKSEILETFYPDVDILNLPYEDNTFDYVVCGMVLEHVEGDVRQAISKCKRVLKPGGIVYHTTNFAYPVHGAPYDFWRFTTHGLKLLHKDWSEIIEVGSWGNTYLLALRIPDLFYIKTPECRFHPLHYIATRNEEDMPQTVWIIARK